MHEHYYWIALRKSVGVGNVLCRNLLGRFETPEAVFHATAAELRQIEGMTQRALGAIQGFRPDPAIERELERTEALGAHLVTLASRGYPEALRHIYDPPAFLYVKGCLECRSDTAIAVVGSRSASDYGLKVTREITRDLARSGITVVSGMARGIDAAAHRAALDAGGQTVAVLGSGLDVPYPPENRRLFSDIAARGAVVSEYPPGTEPNRYNFPARNRIISGMCAGVLVVEASPRSGSLITARLALDQGREVFAVPGSVYSYKCRGTNALLRSGARMVERAADILEELHLPPPAPDGASGLSPGLQSLYALLGDTPVHIDQLQQQTSCAAGQLSAALLALELEGRIHQLPGKRYVRR